MNDGHNAPAPLAIRPLGWVVLAMSAGKLYFLFTEPPSGTQIRYTQEVLEVLTGLSAGSGLLLHGRRAGTLLMVAAVSLGSLALILLLVEQLRR